MSSIVFGWWIKRGLSGPKISTNRSTGMSNCAVSGSCGANASVIISTAKSRSARDSSHGVKTNNCP
jgi:hypothetical protein